MDGHTVVNNAFVWAANLDLKQSRGGGLLPVSCCHQLRSDESTLNANINVHQFKHTSRMADSTKPDPLGSGTLVEPRNLCVDNQLWLTSMLACMHT
jgi:hypothetical protein